MEQDRDTPTNQVCRADNGRFFAFWRGQLVYKLDGTLRYFDDEPTAWDFLARRDSAGDSMITSPRRRTRPPRRASGA